MRDMSRLYPEGPVPSIGSNQVERGYAVSVVTDMMYPPFGELVAL